MPPAVFCRICQSVSTATHYAQSLVVFTGACSKVYGTTHLYRNRHYRFIWVNFRSGWLRVFSTNNNVRQPTSLIPVSSTLCIPILFDDTTVASVTLDYLSGTIAVSGYNTYMGCCTGGVNPEYKRTNLRCEGGLNIRNCSAAPVQSVCRSIAAEDTVLLLQMIHQQS